MKHGQVVHILCDNTWPWIRVTDTHPHTKSFGCGLSRLPVILTLKPYE